MTAQVPETVLVVGGAGMLGKALQRELSRWLSGTRVVSPTHTEMDLSDPAAVSRTVRAVAPQWIFNSAAYTQVDQAEKDVDLAHAINAEGPQALAEAAKRAGAYLVHVSTDYVFDGTKDGPYVEEDPVSPINAYGSTKEAGEKAIAMSGAEALVVRSAWLYGPGGRPNFVDTIRGLLMERPKLSVVNDQRGCPTYTCDLASAILDLSQRRATGILHVVNSGACSWYEFACEIARAMGSLVPIEPVTSDAFRRPAARPRNSVLSCRKFERLTGKRLRPWSEALADYIESFPAAGAPG